MDIQDQRNGSLIGFLRRIDWFAFWIACIASFAVYVYTLAPTVTLEDSGELAVAGDWLGVPHPPGYPLWTMMSFLFARVFSFVHYLGQPNPAWSIALLSAVFGALATGITAMLICRSGSDLLRQSWQTTHDNANYEREDIICSVGGIASSLLFAFSPVMWSQAVIVEVYSLNAFFLALIFLLSYWWMCEPSNKLLYITAFVFGLGLTNYQVLLLAVLPLVIVIMLKDIELFRDFAIVGAPFILFIFVLKGGILGFLESLNDAAGNLSPSITATYIVFNLIILGLAYFLLPRGKTVAITILLVELGLAFYIYMPIVSDLRNPPMNWGYPRTWTGFKHAVTRGQYEKISPTDAFSMLFVHQIGSYLKDMTLQFYMPIALLGFLPFTAWKANIGKRKINALHFAIVCAIISILMLILEPGDIRWDKLPVCGIFLVMGMGVLTIFVNLVIEFWMKLKKHQESTWTEVIVSAAILLGGAIIFLVYARELCGNIRVITEPLRQSNVQLPGDDVSRIFFQCIGLVLLIIMPPAMLISGAWLSRTKYKPEMTIDTTSQKWMIATLMGFLVMSFLLIVLCNPKGDIQDNFIQKVKFISSHALFAFWIGYGIIFVLSVIDNLATSHKTIRNLSIGIACLLPLAPIWKNAFDPVVAKEYGGAEQNGHDFGWQFGNYQLRGADAINEELDSNEEPLPNPEFPEEMTPNAIFFGGTDPGRFVPTYMIYSAEVRSDVYLITQNALADNTYMNVMRDLYGDNIWIPSQADSATSFKIYVDEVNAGKRPKNADLTIDNGRVQVSGALGVMEINGILCQMIFDHNNYKHDFYIEESYVIRWMFPYLIPHGLIMKINKTTTDLTNETVTDDMEFWDWYTRRLTGNNKFMRDVVARKSFSKLRSAIAGAYAARNMLDISEKAFKEALLLYPLSPEANFRMAQEVQIRQGRFEDSIDVLNELGRQDPGNGKVPEFLGQLQNMKNMRDRMAELEKQIPQLDINNALELADLYHKSGQFPKLLGITRSIMSNTNMPPEVQFQVASLLHNARQFQDMVQALETLMSKIPPQAPPEIYLNIAKMYASANVLDKMANALGLYLQRKPDDWRGWMDMSAIQIGMNNTNLARQAMDQAIKFGGNEAMTIINQDQRFASIRRPALTLPANFMGIPSPNKTAAPPRF